MARRVQPAADYDSPWKEALDQFLEVAMELLFPKLHVVIDWSRGYESLGKELQRIVRGSSLGDRLADKLFKVWRRDGTEAWLLIHVEVQGQRQADFPRRMFVYHHRIFERYALFPVSVAILCDEHRRWRPDRFEYNVEGTKGKLAFPDL